MQNNFDRKQWRHLTPEETGARILVVGFIIFGFALLIVNGILLFA